MFAKNERGYRLNAIKKRFWSLLILLLSVASVRRKLIKTSHTEERSAHTNWGSWNIRLRPLKYQFNFKQIIQILQPIAIDYLSRHSYIVDFSSYVLIVMIWELLIKTVIPVSRIFGNEDDIFIFSRNVQKQVGS